MAQTVDLISNWFLSIWAVISAIIAWQCFGHPHYNTVTMERKSIIFDTKNKYVL
jgi:hypothetical protein